jgi:hypothetical protein
MYISTFSNMENSKPPFYPVGRPSENHLNMEVAEFSSWDGWND